MPFERPKNSAIHRIQDLSFRKKGPILQIKPTFAPPFLNDKSFQLYVTSVQKLIEKMIDPNLLSEMEGAQSEQELLAFFEKLMAQLPLFKYSHLQQSPNTLSVVNLCKSESTPGVGRYIADMLCRGLVPGKQLPLVGSRTLSFHFVHVPHTNFYLSENYIRIETQQEMQTIERQIQGLLKEIRINILAVNHAKYIVSRKNLSIEQKSTIIEGNLTPLSKTKNSDYSSRVSHFMKKLSTEEAIDQIKENITYLMETKPEAFERDVFYEIGHFIMRFRESFVAERDPKHVSRIIAFQYLLKKSTSKSIEAEPSKRHLTLKLLKTTLHTKDSSHMVLGILISMNILKDSETFNKHNILQAARSCLPNIQFVKNSYLVDTNDDKNRCLYLEVQKKDLEPFTLDEQKLLKAQLPQELKSRIHSVNHPIFMPRNEEEILRNIISLSKQIKYVRDIPQVIVRFDTQTDEEISFQVIVVRLLKHNSIPLTELIFNKKKSIRFTLDEIRTVGELKNKYIKEANVFHAHLKKASFFRKDLSLDLLKARNKVGQELIKMFGEFRDYNGGLIFKSQESLEKFKRKVSPSLRKHDLLLENFFYSIRPAVMQNIVPNEILQLAFQNFYIAVKHDFHKEPIFCHSQTQKKYFIGCIACPSSSFKDIFGSALPSLKIPEVNLAVSHLKVEGITISTYIYRSSKAYRHTSFLKVMLESLSKSKKKILRKKS